MAVIAGAGLAPAASAQAQETPAPPPASTEATTSEGAGAQLRLDGEHVRQVRERAARLVAEQPAGATVLGGAAAGSGGASTQAAEVNPKVVRHAGGDRYATAAALADAWWRDVFWNETKGPINFEKVVFVASGENFPDALSGGAAAAAWGGPVLLVRKDHLFASTRATLEALRPDAIVVLGGTTAVSTDVEKALRKYVASPDAVTRVAGTSRYDVSASTAALIGQAPAAYVASGENFADGLAGGAAAGTHVAPLLLTKSDDVPNVVMASLKDTVRPKRIYLLGGTTAVNDDVLRELRTIAPVTRIDGQNRYEVARNAADLHPTTEGATMANGLDWPDALAGSAFAGLVGDKLLLLHPERVPLDTQAAMHKHALVGIDVLGGPGALPDSVLNTLRRMRIVTPS